MNKQEAIEKIEKLKGLNVKDKYFILDIEMIPKGDVLEIIEQIDELEKPVVPQFVADWYEEHKGNFEIYLSELCRNFTYHRERLNDKLANWYEQLENKPIQTLVNMHQFGYEVEKEKLYTVEIPIDDSPDDSPLGYHYVLRKTTSGEIIIDSFFRNNWVNYDYCQLTEEEIKKDREWAWKYAKEVKE